jgi:pimeloyl-ACP methyl ester carboxylesterase
LPTANSKGISLTYETQGDPQHPAILLIMGLGMQLTSWPEIFCQGLVDQGFYVIRFDNRDSGLSTKMSHLGKPNLLISYLKTILHLPFSAGYRLDDMASDAVAVLDAAQVEKAHIVGASMGGMIAQIVAARYPERTLSLTSIMSTSGRRGLPGPTPEARRAILSRPARPDDLESVVQHLSRTFRIIGSPGFPTPDEVLRARILTSIKRNVNPAGTLRQLAAIAASGDRVSLLQGLRTRTLVVHGANDPLVPLACGRDTASLVPGSVLREIEGMGHDLAPALNESLLGMISSHCKGQPIPEMRYA